MDLLEAIGTLENALECGVCSAVFEDPVVIGNCGHTFCKKCVSQYLDKNCPTCSVPVSERDTQDDRQLKDLLPLVRMLKVLVEKNANKVCDEEIKDGNEETDLPAENAPTDATLTRGRSSRTPKPPKCKIPNCCNGSPSEHNHHKDEKTPKCGILKKRANSTPGFKSFKRTPYRFSTFSSKNLVNRSIDSKLFSPNNIEKKNLKGETALHVAVIKGDLDKVRELLAMNANPNVEDNAGWTPLHEASNHGFLEIAKLLVEHGAIIDAVGQDSITPLHDSIMNGHMAVAYYLASRGANIHAKTSLGNSSLDLCEKEIAKKTLMKSFNSFAAASAVSVEQEESVNKNEKLLFLCTTLDDSQKEKFQKCAELLLAETTNDFSTEVTHIITSCDSNGQCNRTLKVLQGILCSKWIVNMQWVEICLEYKKRVPEEAFEVPGTRLMPDTFGPKLARENAAKKLPPLFHGCSFYIYGSINPPLPAKEDLCNLIQLGGGKLLNREPRPEVVNEEHATPFHAQNTTLSDVSCFVLYQDKPPRNSQIRTNHIYTVPVRWFIECICSFKILDPDE